MNTLRQLAPKFRGLVAVNAPLRPYGTKRFFDDDYIALRERQKNPRARESDTVIINEVKQLCNHSRIACSKVLALMSELEKGTFKQRPREVIYTRKYGPGRLQSDFSRQVAQYSTCPEDGAEQFVKSEKDYCKEFDPTSQRGNKKRCSKFVKPLPKPKPPPCKQPDPADPKPEDTGDECTLDVDEGCDICLNEISELPDVFTEHKDILREGKDECVESYFAQYKNKEYYMFHPTTYYDINEQIDELRSKNYCTTMLAKRKQEGKCLFVCKQRPPMLIKLPPEPKKCPPVGEE